MGRGQDRRSTGPAGGDFIPRSVFRSVSDHSGPALGPGMDMGPRNSGALSLPNQLSLRGTMGLFTLCWLVRTGQTGFLGVGPPYSGGGPGSGADVGAEGAGSEHLCGLLSS